jgi:nucleotide-binding universal stress UspA family protein
MLRRMVSDLSLSHPGLKILDTRHWDSPAAALLDEAESAGLLVLGARGIGGFPGLLVGSVALRLAGHARCPVVVTPASRPADAGGGTAAASPGEVVLGIDARDPADAVVEFAFDAARRRGVPLRAVHAWSLPAAFAPPPALEIPESDRATCEDLEVQLLSDALRRGRRDNPDVRVVLDVVLFNPAKAVVNASTHAGLLVLGRAEGAGSDHPGPVAHAALHHAPCPVAIVPHG